MVNKRKSKANTLKCHIFRILKTRARERRLGTNTNYELNVHNWKTETRCFACTTSEYAQRIPNARTSAWFEIENYRGRNVVAISDVKMRCDFERGALLLHPTTHHLPSASAGRARVRTIHIKIDFSGVNY